MLSRSRSSRRACRKFIRLESAQEKQPRQGGKLEAEVERLSRSMEGFANRMFENKHIYRYGLVALSELQHLSNLLRETVINEIFEFFHSNVPMTNDKLLAGFRHPRKRFGRLHECAWDCWIRVHSELLTNCVTSSTAITCARMRSVLSTVRRPDTAAAIADARVTVSLGNHDDIQQSLQSSSSAIYLTIFVPRSKGHARRRTTQLPTGLSSVSSTN